MPVLVSCLYSCNGTFPGKRSLRITQPPNTSTTRERVNRRIRTESARLCIVLKCCGNSRLLVARYLKLDLIPAKTPAGSADEYGHESPTKTDRMAGFEVTFSGWSKVPSDTLPTWHRGCAGFLLIHSQGYFHGAVFFGDFALLFKLGGQCLVGRSVVVIAVCCVILDQVVHVFCNRLQNIRRVGSLVPVAKHPIAR